MLAYPQDPAEQGRPAASSVSQDPPGGLIGSYRAHIAAGAIISDPAQARAAEHLQNLWTKLRGYDPHLKPSPGAQGNGGPNGWISRLLRSKRVDEEPADYPGGLYIVGEVGRGKSMLMDLFFETAAVPRKRRIHFHEFMQDVHKRLHVIQQNYDSAPAGEALRVLADGLAAEAALLCFDEFQVHDIGDAMILGRLFEALFARGVVIVATSNTLPDDLFKGQPGYKSFLPFIELIKRHLNVLVLDGGRDYRRERVRGVTNWYVPADARADAAMDAVFRELTDDAPVRSETLTVYGRKLIVPVTAAGVARFDFAALCAEALGPGDYLALATHYETLLIDAIPRLSRDNFDQARRFITLVDTLYEHRVKLYASAAAPPASLYVAGEGARIFERTISRLEEMQSQTYLALAHLT
jgi:cell division protein ZapE